MKKIDGKKIAEEVRNNLKLKIEQEGLKPGLAILQVGNNPASDVYVRNKLIACEKVGINGKLYHFDETVSEQELIDCILKLNDDRDTHGIIVQSPLPNNLNEDYIDEFITPSKDVDGFGTFSLGRLAGNEEGFLSATPAGILELLKYEGIDIAGKKAVVVGRSRIVGRPMALALLNRDATIMVAHSKTENLKEITKLADILIVAIGKANFITADYVKEGAVVIDVGMNRVDGKLTGDVDFASVSEKASFITPVPGGVGPMTIAMLLTNTVISAEKAKNEKIVERKLIK